METGVRFTEVQCNGENKKNVQRSQLAYHGYSHLSGMDTTSALYK